MKNTIENSEEVSGTNLLARKLDFSEDSSAAVPERAQDGGNPILAVPPPPPSYVRAKDRAKLQKTDMNNTSLATSAASFEEDRRAQ